MFALMNGFLAVTILFSLYSYYFNKKFYFYAKPLPILTLIIFRTTTFVQNPNSIDLLIIFALIFGMSGDLFIIFDNKFLFGLASFLIGHILYITYFLLGDIKLNLYATLIISVATVVTLVGMYFTKNKEFKNILIPPIVIYTSVLAFALITAISYDLTKYSKLLFFSIGLGLFFISDGLLSFDKFVRKFKFTYIFILLTYYLAQTLIVYGSF